MIVYEKEYRDYLHERGVGHTDRVPGWTIDSYVSRLNGISEKIEQDISPLLFNGNFTEQGFLAAWNRIEVVVEYHYKPRPLGNCKSNFKRYWEMLNAKNNGRKKESSMPNDIESPGFAGQKKYEEYLYEVRKLKEKRVRDYVSLMNVMARILSRRLTADMVRESAQINHIADELRNVGELKSEDKLTPGTIKNCKTTLRHYCRALNNTDPR